MRVTQIAFVLQLDWSSAHGKLRVFQLDHAGHFWPTPKYRDPSAVLQEYGLRNQDMDGATEAWRFFAE
jgi:poly(3-hydroxybutyrate) depolymerase